MSEGRPTYDLFSGTLQFTPEVHILVDSVRAEAFASDEDLLKYLGVFMSSVRMFCSYLASNLSYRN